MTITTDNEPGKAAAVEPAASPVARRIARELGVDLASIKGTGPRGRIVREDVEAASRATPDRGAGEAVTAVEAPTRVPVSAPPEGDTSKGQVQVVELNRVQQVVARRMVESRTTVPEFALVSEVDMDRCLGLRTQLKELLGSRAPSVNDMVVKACALALREHPRANGSFVDGRFELYSRVNVGIAVASAETLVVPTVFDADRKPLDRIASETRALAERARAGAMTPQELAGGTFTVSNLGMFGVNRFTAVINPPQAGILAVGAAVQRMRVHDGEPALRTVMDVTLSCDHRILYGADAAQFLARIRALLEQPAALLLGGG